MARILLTPRDIHYRALVALIIATLKTMSAELPAEHLWLARFVEVLRSFHLTHPVTHISIGRKLKCDGLRPSCNNCNRRNLPCQYVPVYVQ